jgi:hypothetical protein
VGVRDQLWAEAAAIEATGEALTIPEALWAAAAVEQKARREPDAWEDATNNQLVGLAGKSTGAGLRGLWGFAINADGQRELRVSTAHILENILDIRKDRQSDPVSKRLANVMRDMGWTRHETTIRIAGAPCRGFTKVVENAKAVEKAPEAKPDAPKEVLKLMRIVPGPAKVPTMDRPLRIRRLGKGS